jgi:hypothetical protein
MCFQIISNGGRLIGAALNFWDVPSSALVCQSVNTLNLTLYKHNSKLQRRQYHSQPTGHYPEPKESVQIPGFCKRCRLSPTAHSAQTQLAFIRVSSSSATYGHVILWWYGTHLKWLRHCFLTFAINIISIKWCQYNHAICVHYRPSKSLTWELSRRW